MIGYDDDEDRNRDDDATGDRDGKGNKNDGLRNNIKSRKAFSMAINDKTVPSSILRLSRIAQLVLLCLVALAVTDYTIIYKQV